MATTQKPSTSSVTTATKRPMQTKIFLAKLRTALSIFDDQISSLGEEHATAYETFVTAYKEAFTEIWPKIQAADVTVLLNSVKDTELQELQRLSQQLCPDKAKPTLLQEKTQLAHFRQNSGKFNQQDSRKKSCLVRRRAHSSQTFFQTSLRHTNSMLVWPRD